MRYLIIAAALAGCVETDPDTVMPELSGAVVDVDELELSDLEIELSLVGHGDSDSLVAVERVELFSEPFGSDAEPVATVLADFELGFDRFVSPGDTRDTRLVAVEGAIAGSEICEGSVAVLVCIWGVRPDAPVAAGCDWLEGITPTCR